MGWFSPTRDRIVSKDINNGTRVYYQGAGVWSEAIETAHKFTVEDARRFLDSIVVADGRIHIFKG